MMLQFIDQIEFLRTLAIENGKNPVSILSGNQKKLVKFDNDVWDEITRRKETSRQPVTIQYIINQTLREAFNLKESME